jgi:hypothetical protein
MSGYTQKRKRIGLSRIRRSIKNGKRNVITHYNTRRFTSKNKIFLKNTRLHKNRKRQTAYRAGNQRYMDFTPIYSQLANAAVRSIKDFAEKNKNASELKVRHFFQSSFLAIPTFRIGSSAFPFQIKYKQNTDTPNTINLVFSFIHYFGDIEFQKLYFNKYNGKPYSDLLWENFFKIFKYLLDNGYNPKIIHTIMKDHELEKNIDSLDDKFIGISYEKLYEKVNTTKKEGSDNDLYQIVKYDEFKNLYTNTKNDSNIFFNYYARLRITSIITANTNLQLLCDFLNDLKISLLRNSSRMRFIITPKEYNNTS